MYDKMQVLRQYSPITSIVFEPTIDPDEISLQI